VEKQAKKAKRALTSCPFVYYTRGPTLQALFAAGSATLHFLVEGTLSGFPVCPARFFQRRQARACLAACANETGTPYTTSPAASHRKVLEGFHACACLHNTHGSQLCGC
jgi:hypothetical protein